MKKLRGGDINKKSKRRPDNTSQPEPWRSIIDESQSPPKLSKETPSPHSHMCKVLHGASKLWRDLGGHGRDVGGDP